MSFSCGRRGAPDASANSSPANTTPPKVDPAPQSYADVVDRVAPAVVTIRSSRRVRAPQQFPFFSDPFLQGLFGGRAPGSSQGSTQVQRALGSGVIVTADGSIVTNHHVVDGAEEITVETSDRRTFPAKMTGSDPPSDLAVLKIDSRSLPVLPLGDSDKVRVGDVSLAVGNPLGIGETVTAGIISAKGRSTGLSDGSFQDFLQTDAPINQGNSGGALVNTRAELIGINSQIISPTGGNIGIGFAIPSNMAKTVMDQLKRDGSVRRGRLGIGIQPVTPDLVEALGLKEQRGVIVNSVEPGGPGDRAGLRDGDVILAVNDKPVDDPNTLRNMIASTAPGTDVTLTIWRDGREQKIKARLGSFDSARETSSAPAGPRGSPGSGDLGLVVDNLTPELATQLGLRPDTQGALVADVDPSGPAAEAGIKPNDVIVEVNRQRVRNAAEVRAALQRSGSKPALVLINRGGQNLFITVKPRRAGG